ncbi:MAG: LemA family protein [Desulfobacteraceae bacterium]|nr:LemA family protein [Desulfobacteraceae bacterium]
MSVTVIGVIAGILVLAAFMILFIIITYNGFIYLKNNMDKHWSNIDVLLKQRYDEIPKLVEVCRGYMTHERETLERVIRARNMLGSVPKDSKEFLENQSMLTSALKSLFAVAEQYPELKADSMFARLQSRITELEDSIADRREMYNEVVTIYNIKLQRFPDLVVASFFRFDEGILWEINPAHREDVKISFS